MKSRKRDGDTERLLSTAEESIAESRRILEKMKTVTNERKREMDQTRKDLYDGKKPS